MQDKIIAAIANKIKNLPIDEEGRYCTWFPDNLAREITAAIMPLVVPGVDNPDWKDAPEWAQWLASNNKGLSQWFEDKPIWEDDIQMWDASTEDGRYKFAGKLAKVKELNQRPK